VGSLSNSRPPGFLRQARDAIVSILFPAPCRLCEGLLDTASRVPICETCLASLAPRKGPQQGPMCAVCGRVLFSAQVAGAAVVLCRLCLRQTYGFDRARSYAAYDGAMVRAITLLKYEPIAPLGAWFAARLADMLRADSKELSLDVVVPVPLHPARQRQRGYNQAELIARPLARQLGLPFRSELLVRTKPRPDKLKLSLHERWETVRGAFAPRPGSRVDNLRVLLVDDVMTTGATLDACARALRGAGASQVFGVTAARVSQSRQAAPEPVIQRAKGHRATSARPDKGSGP